MSDEITKQILDELKKLKSDIHEIKSIVSDIPLIRQAVLETSATVNRIETAQERHERILEVLSLRSIEQEAELKRKK